LCLGSFLATMAEEALLEAHVALLTAQLRYHLKNVWLKRRRQQRQQKERSRLWCRERLGQLRHRQFGHIDQRTATINGGAEKGRPGILQELCANTKRDVLRDPDER